MSVSPARRVRRGADVKQDGKVHVVNEGCQLDDGEIHIWQHWMVCVIYIEVLMKRNFRHSGYCFTRKNS